MPEVVRKQAGRDLPLAEKRDAVNALGPSRSGGRAPADPNATPETFQTQRQIYLRGFARGDVQGEGRIQKIVNFYGKLLPDPDNPDNPANLVKDIRPIWFSPEAVKQEIIVGEKKEGEKKEAEKKEAEKKEKDVFYLTEFVLEAYTEGTREKTAKKVIDLLNQARQRELSAISQYMVQHYELANDDYGKLAKVLKATAIAEMKHAEALAERILFLGGVPSTKPDAEAKKGQPLADKMATDIALEAQAIQLYNEAAVACAAALDLVSKDLFEALLRDENAHLDEFINIKEHIDRLGDAYVATLTGPGE
jgi:bacterioferritin